MRMELGLPDLGALLQSVIAIIILVHIDELQVDVGVDVAAAVGGAADWLPTALATAVVFQALRTTRNDLTLTPGAGRGVGLDWELIPPLSDDAVMEDRFSHGAAIHLFGLSGLTALA